MGRHLARARVLYQQERYSESIHQARQALAEQEEGAAECHGLIALCLIEAEQFDQAEHSAREALSQDSADGWTHYVLARVLLVRHRIDAALEAVDQAIRIDPNQATYFTVKGALRMSQSNWKGALEQADAGLALDPEHGGCRNLRAQALLRLGREQEAAETLRGALEDNPQCDATHASQGWVLLQSGQRKQALEHFSEALRLDPNNDWARQGLLEALKAKNPIYRLMLAYFLWMARLTPRTRWGIMIGAVLFVNFGRELTDGHPLLEKLFLPIRIAWFAFVFLTWVAVPLFNLLLFCNRFARRSLDDDQRRGAKLALLYLVAGLSGAPVGWLTGDIRFYWTLIFLAVLLPVSAVFECEPGPPRKKAVLLVTLLTGGALVGLATLGLAQTVPTLETGAQILRVVALVSLLSTWVMAKWTSDVVVR